MKRRNVLGVLGLSIITLGIYAIYWLYVTRKEILMYSADKKAIPRLIILFAPLFAIAGVIVLTAVAGGIAAASQGGQTASTILSVISVIVAVAGVLGFFIVSFWWYLKYFRALEAVVQGNDAMMLYTLWIILTIFGLGPFWMLVVQSDLNKFVENGFRPLKNPSPAYPGNGYAAPQAPMAPMPPQAPPYAPMPPQPQYQQYPQQQQYAAPQPPAYQQPYAPQPHQQEAQPAPHHPEHEQQHEHHEHHGHHQHHEHHENHEHHDQPDQGQPNPPQQPYQG